MLERQRLGARRVHGVGDLERGGRGRDRASAAQEALAVGDQLMVGLEQRLQLLEFRVHGGHVLGRSDRDRCLGAVVLLVLLLLLLLLLLDEVALSREYLGSRAHDRHQPAHQALKLGSNGLELALHLLENEVLGLDRAVVAHACLGLQGLGDRDRRHGGRELAHRRRARRDVVVHDAHTLEQLGCRRHGADGGLATTHAMVAEVA